MSSPYGPTQSLPPQYHPAPEEPESFFHRYRWLFIILGLVLGFGLASVAVAAVLAGNASSAVAALESPSATASSQAPPAASPAVTQPAGTPAAVPSPQPTRTIIIQQPAAQAPAQPGVFTGLRYVGSGVYANASTSDAFALAVHQAYIDGGYWHQPGTSQFWVYSPVTGQDYLMTSSSVGNPVVVTGGNNALVQFSYGG